MCFFTQQTSDAKTLKQRFLAKVESPETLLIKNEIKAFEFPKTPVIVDKNPNVITQYQWGLIPHWSKDSNIQKFTLNAKIETLLEKPSFKYSTNKRCLILANGFYEWKWLDAKGKKKEKYRITTTDNEPFALAGIYNSWVDKGTGELIDTYSIITTEANPLMAEIHNNKKRMPIVLLREDEEKWLQNENYNHFKYPYSHKLEAEIVRPPQVLL